MTKPRVLLLNPCHPYYEIPLMKRPSRIWQPISLGYIAAMLEGEGYPLEFVDANALGLSHDQIREGVVSFDPDIIVLNSAQHDRWQNPIPTLEHMVDLMGLFSPGGRAPALLLLGPHGTAFPELTLRELPRVDFVVRGEPEQTAFNLIRSLQDGEPVDGVKGISFLREGECLHTGDADYIENLDDLPFPAYHLMPMEKYRLRGTGEDEGNRDERFAMIITSRGCPHRCSFCNLTMLGRRYRVRSVGKVLEEIDLLVKEAGVNRLFFHDQALSIRKDRLRELCEGLVGRSYDLSWLCQGIISSFPVELMPLMKDAGCRQISFGLESGAEEIAEKIRKTSIREFIEIWEEGKRIGMDIVPNHMIGLPHETPELAQESNEFFRKFGFKYFFVSPTIPYPGTELYDIGRREGTIKGEDWGSVVDAIGLVDNGFDKDSIAAIMKELFEEEERRSRRSSS